MRQQGRREALSSVSRDPGARVVRRRGVAKTVSAVLWRQALVRLIATASVVLATATQASAQWRGEDRDRDSIDDGVEQQLAERFFPNVHYSRGDEGGCLGPLPLAFPFARKPVLYRAFYPVNVLQFANPNFMVISYSMLYSRDCGGAFPNNVRSHDGDNEAVIVVLQYSQGDWRLLELTTRPHLGAGQAFCERGAYISVPSNGQERLDLWPGYMKHGNFPFRNEDRGCFGRDTVEEPLMETRVTDHKFINMGEPDGEDRMITNLAGVVDGFPTLWAGINPWTDQFLGAGHINATMGMDYHEFNFEPLIERSPDGVPWERFPYAQCEFWWFSPAVDSQVSGGVYEVSFGTHTRCGWRVSATVPWIHVETVSNPSYPYQLGGYAGAGNATISLRVDANVATEPRVGRIVVGGQSLLVSQAGVACDLSLSPSTVNVLASGASGSLTVDTNAPSCEWTAESDEPWISVTSGASGSGPAFLSYNVAGNQSSRPRTGAVRLGAASTQFAQAGVPCGFALAPNARTMSAVGGEGIVTLAAGATDCDWTATSDSPWLTLISPSAGQGAATITYRLVQNLLSKARVGTLTVGGQTLTVTQRGRAATDFDGDGKTDLAIYRPDASEWFVSHSSAGYPSPVGSLYRAFGRPNDQPLAADFDGDGRHDVVTYRPAESRFNVMYSSTGYPDGGTVSYQWGSLGDLPVVGDYDGDGRAELAVYRPRSSQWLISYSSAGYPISTASLARTWGLPSDVPMAADFDGDGRTDIVAYRPAEARYYVLFSSNGFSTSSSGAYQLGTAGDVPIPGDFDGDGRTDLAVYRPSGGAWFVSRSSAGYPPLTAALQLTFGLPSDVPVAADFDGDGKTDIVQYRPQESRFYVRPSSTGFGPGSDTSYQWGTAGDVPVRPFVRRTDLDFDGDEQAELAVYRPSDAKWYVRYSSAGFSNPAPEPSLDVAWGGLVGDVPLQADFDGDRQSDLVIYRPGTPSQYYILLSSKSFAPNAPWSFQWGTSSERPVSGDFDGDGRADLAVYRPSDGRWSIRYSGAGFVNPAPPPSLDLQLGGIAGDVPLAADFDGDGRSDLVIFRAEGAQARFQVRLSSSNFATTATHAWGLPGDIPIMGDFDGDLRADLAVYRPSTAEWRVRYSTHGFAGALDPLSLSVFWGAGGDVPMSADFDGDGRSDIVVYRPDTSPMFFVLRSSQGFSVDAPWALQWGLSADVPVR